jgi:hypothetical protein
LILASAPPSVAICTMRPSSAAATMFLSVYSPPTMSRITSTPLPPVASLQTATKSSDL